MIRTLFRWLFDRRLPREQAAVINKIVYYGCNITVKEGRVYNNGIQIETRGKK